MSRLVDMSAWNQPQSGGAGASRRVQLSYVLVADANLQRAAACLDAIKPFSVGTLVARDGDEATRILERFGPPILLIVDLSLSRRDGFAVIEALCAIDRGRSGIIAWSAFRELREYATHRLSGLNVRVLSGAVSDGVVRSAIDRALRDRVHDERSDDSASLADVTAADLHQMMTELSEKARLLCGTPGVAIYLRAAGETQFRASVTWTSDTPIPHSPYYAPRVFGWVLETGEALVLPDLSTQPLSDVPTSTLQDVVRGLVAVPIVGAGDEVVGTICVFDLKPLTLGGTEVEALKALGRGVSISRTAPPIRSSDREPAHDEPAPDSRAADEVSTYTTRDSSTIGSPDGPRHGGATESEVDAQADAPRGPALERTLSDIESSLRAAADQRRFEPVDPPSTGDTVALLDRRIGDFAIARELARARREKRQLSVVLFDVGPIRAAEPAESVQQMLALVRSTLTKVIRGSDLAIRWSDEGLLVVLAGLGMAEARAVAERVRAALQAGAQYSERRRTDVHESVARRRSRNPADPEAVINDSRCASS